MKFITLKKISEDSWMLNLAPSEEEFVAGEMRVFLKNLGDKLEHTLRILGEEPEEEK